MGRGENYRITLLFMGYYCCTSRAAPVGFLASKPNYILPSQESRSRHFLIGCIGVSGKTKWDVLDGVVRRLFKVTSDTDCPNTELAT